MLNRQERSGFRRFFRNKIGLNPGTPVRKDSKRQARTLFPENRFQVYGPRLLAVIPRYFITSVPPRHSETSLFLHNPHTRTHTYTQKRRLPKQSRGKISYLRPFCVAYTEVLPVRIQKRRPGQEAIHQPSRAYALFTVNECTQNEVV